MIYALVGDVEECSVCTGTMHMGCGTTGDAVDGEGEMIKDVVAQRRAALLSRVLAAQICLQIATQTTKLVTSETAKRSTETPVPTEPVIIFPQKR